MATRLAGAGAGLAVAVFSLVPAAAQAATSGGTWGTAAQVPGLPALSSSSILSLSCASPGNCSAGGYLISGNQEAMVVSEANGIWGNVEVVPGSVALNTGHAAQIDSVSCASPGNCSAVGEYSTPAARAQPLHPFVVSETNGTWGIALKVPGLAAVGTGNSQLHSISCASPGNCTAGGYLTSGSLQQPLAVSQVNGKWGDAQKIPGLPTQNTIGVINSVSCAAPGNCSAGGDFVNPPGTGLKAFVVVQRKSTWGKALQIRGVSEIDALSCATASDCSAGGRSFAVSKVNGSWGKAVAVPGLAKLSQGNGAHIETLSCGAPGDCAAGGFFSTGSDGNGDDLAFLATQTHGTWSTAEKVPGLPAGAFSFVNSVSCGAAGTCAAVGSDLSSATRRTSGFVISEDNGTWGTAINPPGLGALNKGGAAQINAVSCTTADECTAGGDYGSANHDGPQSFTVSETATPAP